MQSVFALSSVNLLVLDMDAITMGKNMGTFCELRGLEWTKEAGSFLRKCQKNLMTTPEALWAAHNFGLTRGTIEDYQLGWNYSSTYLPEGLVVPTFDSQVPVRISIFTQDKTFIVPGSQNPFGIFGIPQENKPIIIVDSELHAILLNQMAGDIVCPMTLGSGCNILIKDAPHLFFAINDLKAFKEWQKVYPNISFWPVKTFNQDPFKIGMEMRDWILEGIEANQLIKVLQKT